MTSLGLTIIISDDLGRFTSSLSSCNFPIRWVRAAVVQGVDFRY